MPCSALGDPATRDAEHVHLLGTAIEEVDARQFVFYGMADSRIGVAELERA